MREGERPARLEGDVWPRVVYDSICWVKSIKRFVVLPSFVGDLCLRGVGDGDLEGEVRFLDAFGVDCCEYVAAYKLTFISLASTGSLARSFTMLWSLTGLCLLSPSLANKVISGTAENVLKQVSSTPVSSCPPPI